MPVSLTCLMSSNLEKKVTWQLFKYVFTLDYLSFTINCYLQEVNGDSDCDPYYDTVGKHFNLSIVKLSLSLNL